MRLANLSGHATVLSPTGAVDVADASGGRFGPEIQSLYPRWGDFRAWADRWILGGEARGAAASATEAGGAARAATETGGGAGSPAPAPTQVFGIGRNYREHAAETGSEVSEIPATFTKYPTCLTGDQAEVTLPSASVDWEVELVVVIGTPAWRVAEADGWRHVAGLTIGQDLSERRVQYAAGSQFSLGKSYPGFGPMGPALVTPDELAHPDDLAISCQVNGETVQQSRTSEMVFGVARLIAELSAIVPLLPGDVIFTGTPAGVGFARTPPRFLAPGDVITSTIEGIGTLTTRCVAGDG
jgi:2,4-diketo-3-deoxy-L-fuconate hydrolase